MPNALKFKQLALSKDKSLLDAALQSTLALKHRRSTASPTLWGRGRQENAEINVSLLAITPHSKASFTQSR